MARLQVGSASRDGRPYDEELSVKSLRGKSAVELEALLGQEDLVHTVGHVRIPVDRISFSDEKNIVYLLGRRMYDDASRLDYIYSRFSWLSRETETGNPDTVNGVVKMICMKNATDFGMDGMMYSVLQSRAAHQLFQKEAVQLVTDYRWREWGRRVARTAFMFHFIRTSFFAAYTMQTAGYLEFGRPYALLSFILMMMVPEFVFRAMALIHYAKQYDFHGDNSMTCFWISHRTINAILAASSDGNSHELFVSLPFWLMCVLMVKRSRLSFYLATDRDEVLWTIKRTVYYYRISVRTAALTALLATHVFLGVQQWSDVNNESVDATLTWLVVFHLVLFRIQLARAFYYTLDRPGPLFMFAGEFANNLFEFVILMVYILLAFSSALNYIYMRLPERSDEAASAGASDVETDENCGASFDSFSNRYSSMYTLFFAMLGNVEVEDFEAITGSLFTLAMILIVTFVCIEAIVMLNLMIAILGDGFDRVKSTEDATRLHNFARFMFEWEITLSAFRERSIGNMSHTGSNIEDIGELSGLGYLYVIQKPDLCSSSAEWTGRVGAIKEHVDKANQSLAVKIHEGFAELSAKQEVCDERFLRIQTNQLLLEQRLGRMEKVITELLKELKEGADAVHQEQDDASHNGGQEF